MNGIINIIDGLDNGGSLKEAISRVNLMLEIKRDELAQFTEGEVLNDLEVVIKRKIIEDISNLEMTLDYIKTSPRYS